MLSEVFEADVKNGIALKKACIAMTELIKSISTWIELQQKLFLKSSVIKYVRIY